MKLEFPSKEWVEAFVAVLNEDERYAEIARKWEGDLAFVIEADEGLDAPVMVIYMDLWHGKCRGWGTYTEGDPEIPEPKFFLTATRSQFMRVLRGELDPMQAMMTRRLKVRGDMGYMLRNIPTVLDFVRCAQQVSLVEG